MLRCLVFGGEVSWLVQQNGDKHSSEPVTFNLPGGAAAGFFELTSSSPGQAPAGFHFILTADGVELYNNSCVTNAVITVQIPANTAQVVITFLPTCGVPSTEPTWLFHGESNS